ncbi:MAG: preprotein translocase subunit YajC [Calditrichaeota bacterium]|nr:preprotein translocase subunit YajC [Calditrichota bacterium]MCB0268487.1 preprotein translocase subunit YajC [Calditrichota bacterium]MCB0288268.1 preprotein translocase subunit YajC [Calditrichota bacterium]MCB0300771.1 preprotein translocase subunit YajC [Calditrichota bacterium]MCB9066267.1 preprotein translocase subunit YajC [Calditrichia bacterium]
MFGGFAYLLLIIGIFYFFIIRPQQKQKKERDLMLAALQKGDNVVTLGGIYGKVLGFKNEDKVVVLKVDTNTNLDIDRTAITQVVKSKGGDA